MNDPIKYHSATMKAPDELSIFSLSHAKQKLVIIVPGERVILAETYDHYLLMCVTFCDCVSAYQSIGDDSRIENIPDSLNNVYCRREIKIELMSSNNKYEFTSY